MKLKELLCEKYQLPIEEAYALYQIGYDLCVLELGKDVADIYFKRPVRLGTDGNIEPIKEREVN